MRRPPEQVEQIVWVTETCLRTFDLVALAHERLGFGDSDAGFGVVYPDNLDEYAKRVEGVAIPDNHVEIYGRWGRPEDLGFQFVVEETEYLSVLERILRTRGRTQDADIIRGIIDQSSGTSV